MINDDDDDGHDEIILQWTGSVSCLLFLSFFCFRFFFSLVSFSLLCLYFSWVGSDEEEEIFGD